MKRILVTGATGFLGSHLVRALLERGFEVVATGRDSSRAAQAADAPLTFIAADLSSSDQVQNLAYRAGAIQAVVHSAALSSPWGSRAAFHQANVAATSNVLDLARRAAAERFVYISTPSVYFRFEDQLCVREHDPLPAPINQYARSKRQAEELVLQSPDVVPFVIRPRGIYGSGDTALLPRLVRAARRRPLPLLRGGRAVTDLTHVSDVANAIIAALEAPATSSGIYNVSGGEPLSLKHVIERVCENSGVTARWLPTSVKAALAAARAMEWACACLRGQPEPPITRYGVGVLAFSQTLNIEAAQRALNWAPQVSFERGLALTFREGARGA